MYTALCDFDRFGSLRLNVQLLPLDCSIMLNHSDGIVHLEFMSFPSRQRTPFLISYGFDPSLRTLRSRWRLTLRFWAPLSQAGVGLVRQKVIVALEVAHLDVCPLLRLGGAQVHYMRYIVGVARMLYCVHR